MCDCVDYFDHAPPFDHPCPVCGNAVKDGTWRKLNSGLWVCPSCIPIIHSGQIMYNRVAKDNDDSKNCTITIGDAPLQWKTISEYLDESCIPPSGYKLVGVEFGENSKDTVVFDDTECWETTDIYLDVCCECLQPLGFAYRMPDGGLICQKCYGKHVDSYYRYLKEFEKPEKQ